MGSCVSRSTDAVQTHDNETEQVEPTERIQIVQLPEAKQTKEVIDAPRSTSSKSDILCGVSNVVYRKEYIQNVYALTSEELGTGVSGSVRVVIDRETNERFALKTINLLGLSQKMRERVITESMILARLHHQNIVKLYEIYESGNAIYLVMELLSGGELFDRLMAQPDHKFSEDYACRVVKDILNAITYLHDYKNIAHRDLKLSNIMFSDNTPDAELKLIDFGLSKLMVNADYTHSLVGTRNYIAPEVYMKDYQGIGYTKACDMWSIGIIAYFILTGRNPVPAQSDKDTLNPIKKKIPYPAKYWNTISPEARDFVDRLLVFDPAKRLTASQAQEHPWFKRLTPAVIHDLSPAFVENLQTFQGFNRLKKAAMTAVAYHLNNKELQHLEKMFEFFDTNNTGSISMEEFRQAISSLTKFATIQKNQQEKASVLEQSDSSYSQVYETISNLNANEHMLSDLFNGIDFNNTGYIDYSEFLAACLARKEGLKREYAELIFDLVDREHKGFIQVEDLHIFFGESIPTEEIERIIERTFGERKAVLTESDLEKIMSTKMITNDVTSGVIDQQTTIGAVPLPTKTALNNLFSGFKTTTETMIKDPAIVLQTSFINKDVLLDGLTKETPPRLHSFTFADGTESDLAALHRYSSIRYVSNELASKPNSSPVQL